MMTLGTPGMSVGGAGRAAEVAGASESTDDVESMGSMDMSVPKRKC